MKQFFFILIALLPLQFIGAQSILPDTTLVEEDQEVQRFPNAKMEKEDYIPLIHGTIRARYDWQPQMHASRFAVRTARVSIEGHVLPILGYKAQIDLSDYGQVKMLDAYMRVFPVEGLTITAGQMRVPFGLDAHRSPHTQFFANRSFIAKEVGNLRDVGVFLGYKLPIKMPISIEAGMHNGKGIYDQKEAWTKDFSYSGKLSLGFVEGMNFVLSAQTLKPDQVRINSYDVALSYEFWRFHVEGEYLYKQYANKAFSDAQAANAFIAYYQPLPKVFDNISFLARYDYMTNHWDGKNEIQITDYERQRLTAGVTLSMRPFKKDNGKIAGVFRDAAESFRFDIRVNYEKYFYAQPNTAQADEQDKLVVELMLYF